MSNAKLLKMVCQNWHSDRYVYICDTCNKLVEIKRVQPSKHSYISINSEIENIEISRMDIDFTIRCVDCDNYMFKCDIVMSKRIQDLNRLGLDTMYCCQGHFNKTIHPFTNTGVEFTIDMPYLAFSPNTNKNILDIIKALLLFQEYGFINFEEKDEYCDMYNIRGSLNGESIIEINENRSDNEIQELYECFIDMQNKFFEFIDNLINILEHENNIVDE